MEAVIEAILFTMGESVELKKIAAAIEHDEATTRKIIHRLQDKYLALIPGTSRSGATILGGLYSGCTRTLSSEYSFFIAIPTMAGASLLKIVKYVHVNGMFPMSQLFLLLLGTFISFVVSLFAIRSLINYVKKHDFTVFGYYRIVLGILVLLLFYVLR